MTTPSFNDIYTYSKQVQGISQKARADFLKIAEQIDFSDWTVAAEELREAVVAIVEAYGPAAGELGAQWYEYCRYMEFTRGYTAIVGEVSRYGVKSDANAAIDKLFDGQITEEDLTARLAGVVVDQVKKQTRDTVLNNLLEDRRQAEAKNDREFLDRCGYARVPVGETCAFCIMLASRGFVYTSEKTALTDTLGNKYHANCDCKVVPFHGAGTISGYGDMLSQYQKQYYDAVEAMRNNDLSDEMKERIANAKAEHMARYRAGETKEPWRSFNEITMIMREQNPGMH